MTSEPVRVVLADDHPMYRYGVAAVLATADEIELVGEASDGRALIALVGAERPDVVLTDLAMPNSEIARRLGMTDKTVRNHVSAILMKLQVTDRTAAAIKARDAR